MPTACETASRVCGLFTVRDIMLPKDSLVCGRNEEEAERLLDEHPTYDVVPVLDRDGAVRWYVERGSTVRKNILPDDMIPADTCILDLVTVLAERKFCFVPAGCVVGGYVHFSDLNNPIVRVPFFALVGMVEQVLVQKLRPIVDERVLEECLPSEDMRKLRQKMSEMRKDRADLDWLSLLLFRQVLHVARRKNALTVSGAETSDLNELRNSVCHAATVLVSKHEDVARLARVRDICFSIMNVAS